LGYLRAWLGSSRLKGSTGSIINGRETHKIGRDPFGIEHFGCERQTLFPCTVQKVANELHDHLLLFSRDLGEHWEL
jgi:hypothetical protein